MYMMVTCIPTKRWTLTLPKFDEPFSVQFHFEKILWGNRRRLMWGSYFWLRTTWLYTQWLQMYQRKDGLSHYWKFDEPFGARFHFEKFLGNWRRSMWGSYFWLRMTRLCTQWLQAYQQKDGLSHYQNSTSLSAFGSILKDFWEPMSVDARVVLLVEDDKVHNGYKRINEKIDSHIIKIRRAFRRLILFFERFLGTDVG